MWLWLALLSALLLGFYDITKKQALAKNGPIEVLFAATAISTLLLSPCLIIYGGPWEHHLMLMAKAGYDPHASVDFWTRFSSNSSASLLGNLMSTHPCDADRIAAMNNDMPRAEKEYENARNKRGYGITFSHAAGKKK